MPTNRFKYLGVIYSTENEMLVELNNRIAKFTEAFNTFYPILKDKHVPSGVKLVMVMRLGL